jgi:oligoendopeptidase F
MRLSCPRPVLPLLLALLMLPAVARATERSEVAPKYKWDLTALFPDEAHWKSAKEAIAAGIPGLGQYQGHLGDSPQSLLAGLSAGMKLREEFERVYTYASQHYDEDTRVSRSQEMEQEADELGVRLRTAASFMRPEIIALGQEKLDR